MKKQKETSGNIVVLVPKTMKKEAEKLEEIMQLIKDNKVRVAVIDTEIFKILKK